MVSSEEGEYYVAGNEGVAEIFELGEQVKANGKFGLNDWVIPARSAFGKSIQQFPPPLLMKKWVRNLEEYGCRKRRRLDKAK